MTNSHRAKSKHLHYYLFRGFNYMSKYAQAAVQTVRRNQNKKTPDMRSEWEISMREMFPTQEASRKKGCPKNAFLGLCEEGYVVGIPLGSYNVKAKNRNKNYAIDAAKLVSNGLIDEKMLWIAVAGPRKTSNSQVKIVLALFEAKMLII